MVQLKNSITSELIKQCEKELQNAKIYEFQSIEEVVNNIGRKENIGKGIIYFLVSNDKENTILYIGKSKGKRFRQRVKAHFFNIGKGTHSKNCFIQNETKKNRKVFLKYIVIEDEPLRNYIEEILLKKYNDKKQMWNYKKCP